MGILTGALVIVGVVAVLNLVLTFGVIRRLREHDDLIVEGAGASRGAPTMVGVGESIPPFTATAVDGRRVSSDRLAELTLIGVFAPGCAACEEKLPVFVSQAVAFPGGRQNVLALVIASDDGAAASYVEALADVAVVVREDQHGPAAVALGVTGYPSFAHVGGGAVRASALDPRRLPTLIPTI